MSIDGEIAAHALTSTWEHIGAAVPDGWTRRQRGALAAVTMVPVPTLNSVFVDALDANLEVVTALLDEVAATRLPHSLQIRPGCGPVLAQLAQRRGMREDAEIPLMVLEGSDARADVQPAELVIRSLSPEEAHLHADLAAAGFGAPQEYFRNLMTPAVLSAPGACCYLGEVGSEPVTTGFAVTLGGFVAIFNVATTPPYRRRGYGAAVTIRAVRDGLSNGAKWAWLQSSSVGYPVYKRLGFRTIESWRCWVAAL